MKLKSALLWSFFTWLGRAKQTLETGPLQYDADLDRGALGSYPVHKFVSSPLTAPRTNFRQWSDECDERHYLITPRGWKVAGPGPMILDSSGSLVWSKHFTNDFGGQAYDLKVQSYKGKSYLTFWLGDDRVRGHGAGHFYMLNASYDVVHTISAASNRFADLHEFIITPGNTAINVVFEVASFDVRPAGRKSSDVWNQAIWDCLFQEIDVESGDLLFEWRASDHINITHSYNKLKTSDEGTQANPFDPFHLNSVEKDTLGNYLVSVRNLHAILYIHGKTGDIIWTIGGKGNLFADLSEGHAINFAWQHDARIVSPLSLPESYQPPKPIAGMTTRLISMFDNAALDWDYSYGLSYSRGLLLELRYPTPGYTETVADEGDASGKRADVSPTRPRAALSKQDTEKIAAINGSSSLHSVRVVQELVNPLKVRSSTQGSMQLLPKGAGIEPRFLVGYGLNAVATEFNSNGSVICDMHYGAQPSWETGDIQSYRSYKQRWIGRPREPPRMIIKGRKAFISWNGATEVRSWLLQGCESLQSEDWVDVATFPKAGFETSVTLPGQQRQGRFIRTIALDANGQPCEHGISQVISRGYFDTIMTHTTSRDFWMSYEAPLFLICGIIGLLGLYRLFLRYLSSRRLR